MEVMKYLAYTLNENTAKMRMQLKGYIKKKFIELNAYIQK